MGLTLFICKNALLFYCIKNNYSVLKCNIQPFSLQIE